MSGHRLFLGVEDLQLGLVASCSSHMHTYTYTKGLTPMAWISDRFPRQYVCRQDPSNRPRRGSTESQMSCVSRALDYPKIPRSPFPRSSIEGIRQQLVDKPAGRDFGVISAGSHRTLASCSVLHKRRIDKDRPDWAISCPATQRESRRAVPRSRIPWLRFPTAGLGDAIVVHNFEPDK
jgi:hypothetical protein